MSAEGTDHLEDYVARLRAELDPVRLEAEVGSAVAGLAAAERGAVAWALRAGAALHELREKTPGGEYMDAVRRAFGRSHRSATNYGRLYTAYRDGSLEMRGAILAATSLRRALQVLEPRRAGRKATLPGPEPAPAPLDADVLLRACAGRARGIREIQKLFEAAAALAGGGDPGADPAAAVAAALAAAFGTADPMALRAGAARAGDAYAAAADERRAEVFDAEDAKAPAVADVAPMTIAGVVVGMCDGEAGAVSPATVAAFLEEVVAAVRALALPGSEALAGTGPLAVLFEAYMGAGGVPLADALVAAPFVAVKATAPRAGAARSPEALARTGIVRAGGERAVLVGAPHTATIKALAGLGAATPILAAHPDRDADCLGAASAAADAPGSRGAIGRALRRRDWEAWPEARSLKGVLAAMLSAADGARPVHADNQDVASSGKPWQLSP